MTNSVIVLLRLMNALPFNAQIRIGKFFGLVLYRLAKTRRHIAHVNISLCFPTLSQDQQRSLVKKSFVNYGIGLTEAAMAWWSNPRSFDAKVTLEGREYLDQALSGGKGVILLGAHYSTLDLGGLLFSRFYPLSCMYRPNKNEFLEHSIRSGRLRYLESLIGKSDFRSVLKKLRQNKIVWYAPDQDFGPNNAVFAPFFGVEAATTTATARLAKLSGAPVVLISHHRTEAGNYTVRLHPALPNFPDPDDAVSAAAVNKAIETGISYDTAQYMWVHRRFKTRPTGSPGSPYIQSNFEDN